jgi:probable rRNA maturation factor
MILFFSEGVEFTLEFPSLISDWVSEVVKTETKLLGAISFIFCSDVYLLKLNQEHLDHDYFTDVITFDYSETSPTLSGDVFISIDRVTENAKTLSCSFDDELHRVIIHGALHLCGYNDKTDAEKKEMRKKEDHYLSLRPFSE